MLGDKIKLYRENKKMTQNELADILEVSSGTVSKYESGILEPSIESIKRLSELFGISIDELLKDENKKISNTNESIHKKRDKKETELHTQPKQQPKYAQQKDYSGILKALKIIAYILLAPFFLIIFTVVALTKDA